MQHTAIWLFDSHCVLCSRGVRYSLRREKAATIRFVAVQSGEGRALAQGQGIDPDDPSTFLFIENGFALNASDAVIALAQHLKGLGFIARLCRNILRRLRKAAYPLRARNCFSLIDKPDQCIITTAEQHHRFVL